MKNGKTSEKETTIPAHRRAWTPRICFGAGAAVFLLCLGLFFIHEAPVAGKFAWLDPSTFAQPGPPGPLTKLRRRLETLPGIASLVARYRGTRPYISITAAVWSLPSGAEAQALPGPPLATNADGIRVWILPAAAALPPSVLDNFNARLANLDGAAMISRSSIWVLNGTQGEIRRGKWANSAGRNLFGGLVIDAAGKFVFSSVKLSVGVTATQLVPSPSGGAPTVKTNLTAGCQAVVENKGALVIDAGYANDDTGKVYWIVLSPEALDARGIPIGLK